MSNHLKIVSGSYSVAGTSPNNERNELDKFDIKEVIRNSRDLAGEFIVIKIPNSIIKSDSLLENYCENIFYLSYIGANIVIIPELCSNIKAQDEKEAETLLSFQAHLDARKIIKILNKYEIKGISFCAADLALIKAKSKKQSHHNDKETNFIIEGEIVETDPEILFSLQNSNVVTIITPIALQLNTDKEIAIDSNETAAIITDRIDARLLIMPIEKDNTQINAAWFKKLNSQNLSEIKLIELDIKDAILKAVFKSRS